MDKNLFVGGKNFHWKDACPIGLHEALSSAPKLSFIGIKCGSKKRFISIFRMCVELNLVPVVISGGVTDELLNRLYLIVDSESDSVKWGLCNPDAVSEDINIAYVCQTSGSTGDKKSVLITTDAVSYQVESLTSVLGYGQADTVGLPITPWSAYGLSIIFCWIFQKINLSIIDSTHPVEIIDLMSSTGVTIFDATPQIYTLLVKYLSECPTRIEKCSHVRIWSCGGDFLSPALAHKWSSITEMPLLDGYGQSEATVNISLNSPSFYEPGTVGRPLPGTVVAIDPITQEILVKTPSLMKGYWHDLESTAKKITHDGWLHTGDTGYLAESGALRITGRLDNQIKINGRVINLETIESALTSHPCVTNAMVTPIALKNGLIKLSAKITSKDPMINLSEVKHYVASKLDITFRPKEYFVVESIPVNQNGKIDRKS